MIVIASTFACMKEQFLRQQHGRGQKSRHNVHTAQLCLRSKWPHSLNVLIYSAAVVQSFGAVIKLSLLLQDYSSFLFVFTRQSDAPGHCNITQKKRTHKNTRWLSWPIATLAYLTFKKNWKKFAFIFIYDMFYLFFKSSSCNDNGCPDVVRL